MKTLTPDQRMEGFIELEGVLGEGGVGGAHLMSFLAGVAHAEKVLASQEQDDEPVAWIVDGRLKWKCRCVDFDDCQPLYLNPAPRQEFVRLSEKELRSCFTKTNKTEPLSEGWPGLERFARAIEDALEEKNK